MAIIDTTVFNERLEAMLRDSPLNVTEKGKEFARKKGTQLIRLFQQLENKGMLKNPQKIDYPKIESILRNFDDVNTFMKTMFRIYEGYKGTDRTRTSIPFYNYKKEELSISITQWIIFLGWLYLSLCEVMATMLSEVIEFKKEPTGIGNAIMQLKDIKPDIDLSYFDETDNYIRNAFGHLTFKFHNGEIIIPKRQKPLQITELFQGTKDIDMAIFILMGVITTFFKTPKTESTQPPS